MRSNSHMTLSEPTLEVEERESLLDCDVKHHCEHHCRPVHTQKEKCDFHRQLRQKSYAAQRSILKNSQDNAANEGDDLFEAKKQLILRRRRLFSHYRQYEQWRRRQFSYDYCYHRPLPPAPTSLLPLHKTICPNYLNSLSSTNPNAFRRRRLYRRQFSYAERSRDDSHDSKDSYHLPKCHSMAASDTIRTDSTTLNHTNLTTERHSFDSSECGALAAYQPLHCSSSRHFHFFPEEHSASISERITRSRINSAIFVSSEGRGFDSIEFLRRHGSQSVLCRKAKSAENITDNGRKKSFSEKRQWQTDDNNDVGNDSDGQNEYSIELQECSKSVENHPIAALKNNVEKLLAATTVLGHSAAVTTSNRIVGSISIETPPPHIRDMERQQQKQQQQQQQRQQQQQQPQQHEQRDNVTTIAPSISLANTASINSTFHDSADTVEELVLTPVDNTTMNAKNSNYNNINPLTNNNNICRSPILIQQRSSTASPALTPQLQAQDNSPKAIKLKCLTPKISNLPMVSVSGPSPPDEKPPPPEYL
ncbi:uncharacterized protein ACN427_002647 isoform 6-T7 [Glossina fuscipes fuscipes]